MSKGLLKGIEAGATCHSGLPYPMCWHYLLSFDPVVGRHRLAGAGHFTVVVLLDNSIVEPRVNRTIANQCHVGGSSDPGVSSGGGSKPQEIADRPPEPDPATGAYRFGKGVTLPQVVREIRPQYPRDAMRAKLEGTVMLEGIVRTDGTVSNVRVVRSLDPRIDAAAIKAFMNSRFRPGTVNRVPVPVLIGYEMWFGLR
ncbi:MAG: energy transducer TonB [Acidobacteriota bacterium]